MANQRSPNKRLIGAQVSSELSDAIDAWLVANPGKSMTDFILAASVEKLKSAGIRLDVRTALRDGRVRQPGQVKYAINRPETEAASINDRAANSSSTSIRGAESMLDTALVEAAKLQRRRGVDVPIVQKSGPSPAGQTSPGRHISTPKPVPR